MNFVSSLKIIFLRGKSAKITKEKLDKYYDTSTPSDYMVKYWFAEFKRGRTDTNDEHRSGRPKEVTTQEMINKIHDIVLNNRGVKVRELEEAFNISHGTAISILHQHLHMKKLSVRWVPRLLTIDNKRKRVTTSEQCLDLIKRNPNDFWRRFITVDETWIHWYTTETKSQSKQWVEAGSSAPKKAKTVHSAGKVMATVFWDSSGIIFIDYLEKGKTITGEYYATLLNQLNDAIKEKRPHLQKKKVLFHQVNGPAQTSTIAMAKIYELRYELMPHPPYSSNLASSDFFLFPNLKKWFGGKGLTSNKEVIDETNAYFEELDKSYYSDGIKKLENRLTKCIELKGDYVEK